MPLTTTYQATFAEPGTEESIKLDRGWSGAWYVAELATRRESRIVSKAFKTEALAQKHAEIIRGSADL